MQCLALFENCDDLTASADGDKLLAGHVFGPEAPSPQPSPARGEGVELTRAS